MKSGLLVSLLNKAPNMYADPALIKKHEFKIRVDDPVEEKIIKFAGGKQPAAYLRELIEKALAMEEAKQSMSQPQTH